MRYSKVKETNLKGCTVVGLQLQHVLEKAKPWTQQRDHQLPEIKGEGGLNRGAWRILGLLHPKPQSV